MYSLFARYLTRDNNLGMGRRGKSKGGKIGGTRRDASCGGKNDTVIFYWKNKIFYWFFRGSCMKYDNKWYLLEECMAILYLVCNESMPYGWKHEAQHAYCILSVPLLIAKSKHF